MLNLTDEEICVVIKALNFYLKEGKEDKGIIETILFKLT